MDTIVLSSAGTLCVAAVALSTLVVQLWRYRAQPETPASGWGAALAGTTLVYALAVFVQYNTPVGQANRLSEYFQYTAFPLLVQGVYGYTLSSLRMPARRYHLVAGGFHAVLLLLLWCTDLVVAPTWVERDFLFLTQPYVEPALGPLGALFLAYCGIASLVALRHWLKDSVRGGRASWTFVIGFSVWVAAALHDIVVTLGVTSVQYLMEYGFCGFSLATASAVVHEGVARHAEARRAWMAAEQRLAVQFEGSPLAFIQWDQDFRVTEWNPAAVSIFGWPRQEALGRTAYGLIVPEDQKESVERVWSALLERSGGTRSTNVNLTADGRMIVCEWHNTPLLDADGLVVGVASLVQDITARLEAEAAAERARDSAEAASLAKSQFLANMSHEIRTPMNGVMGMLDLLNNTPLDGRQRALLDGAVRSSESLLHIIDEILDLSRIEAGRLALEASDFDIRQVVEDAVGLFAERAHRAGLALTCALEEDIPAVVEGDPLRLTQIIANLLGNALKFTSEGSVEIEVSLAERDPTWPLLHFEVRDTGIGVSRAKRRQIFETFAQEDATTTRRYGGSGLGLAICQRLSQLMGGTTGLSSVPGEGSTFWFTVRLKVVQMHDPGDLEARQALTGRRVLLVADEEATAALGRRLRRWGIPWAAADASNIVDRLEVGGWDLVLVDEVLADSSGVVVARRLIDLPRSLRVPLLLVASVGLPMDEVRAEELGIDAWVTRPIATRRFRSVLVQLMAGGEPAPLPVEQEAEPVRPDLRYAARVLLAEDNAVNRVVGQTMLEDVGCRVVHAADGLEAVERADAEPFDLILMDCQMPRMDGYEATGAIRSGDGPNRGTPIVAVTAHAMADARETCLEAGMSDYLAKPFRRAELERLLARWLAKAARLDAAGAGARGPALDAARLDEVLGFDSPGRDSLLERLATMWRDDGELLVAEIRHDWSEGDMPEVREGALALARTADGIGGVRLAGLARRLARAAGDEDRSTLDQLVPLLPDEHQALCVALDEEMAGQT